MKILPIKSTSMVAMIDDEDYFRCSEHSWFLTGSRRVIATAFKCKQLRLANFIMDTFNVIYDHKDRDFLNNQKYNLRIVTPHQNSMNRWKANFRDTTSIFKGVSFCRDPKVAHKPWKAGIKYLGQHIHLGYFADEKDAALAYNKAAEKYYGEFAVFNNLL